MASLATSNGNGAALYPVQQQQLQQQQQSSSTSSSTASSSSATRRPVQDGHNLEKRQMADKEKGQSKSTPLPPSSNPSPPPPPPTYAIIPENWKPTKDVRARLPLSLQRWTGYRDPSSKPPHACLPIPPFTWLARLPLQYETWILSTGVFISYLS